MSTEMASSTCVGTSTSSHRVGTTARQTIVLNAVTPFENSSLNVATSTTTTSTTTTRNSDDDERLANVDVNVVTTDMDLVNGPNPWLPAYGFQLQQHNQHFQPTHEDLRANDPALVQQGDFLETILEETSDDLQSDSDRSGTTYWLGSDSETESVIHIKANQRAADERPDGSGSECNSVVPKKRRRRNASQDRDASMTLTDEHWTSPRSSRSSESSSRSSSLLQFESLERTCATVSPSGYSYDSLEYSNRSNSHFENTSPDSLEEDCDDDDDDDDQVIRGHSRLNGFPDVARNGFGKLRPYRSFESLDTCHKNEIETGNDLSNGFSASFYSKTSNDLSARGRINDRGQREFWRDNDQYEEDYEYEDDEEEEEDLDEEVESRETRESRIYDPYESRMGGGLLSFTDCNVPSYSTSLDFRNTIDLREIGIETRRDAVFDDLKASGQASSCALGASASSRLLQTTRLNIAGVVDGCGVGSGGNMAGNGLGSNGFLQHHRHHHHHHHRQPHASQQSHQNQRGWSNSSGFNFRFTDKSRSAPSLASFVDESSSRASTSGRSPRSSDYYPGASIGTISSSSLFENYTRVASVPVDLNLCGRDDNVNDSEKDVTITYDNVDELCRSDLRIHEMADDSGLSAQSSIESSKSSERTNASSSSSSSYRRRDENDDDSENTTVIGKPCVRTRSVRTQVRPEVTGVNVEQASVSDVIANNEVDGTAKMHLDENSIRSSNEEGEDDEDTVEETSQSGSPSRDIEPPRSTVKTQDRGNSNVLEMAMAMENDIDAVVDEAIRQFKREVEEATGAGGNTAILAMEAMQRLTSGKPRQNRRVKNNASYELAQQFEIDERNFRDAGKMASCVEDEVEGAPSSPGGSGTRKRVLNNASYELAQQSDYIKMLQSNSRPFQRMDACDELPEVPRPTIACGVKVVDLVREMGNDPGSSVGRKASTAVEIVGCEKKTNDVLVASSTDQRVHADVDRRDNHVVSRPKNYDQQPQQQQQQQQDSLMGQIKKNSDLFSLYGESGSSGLSRTLGRVDGNHDDEVDYPCLETKPILDISDISDVDENSRQRKTRTMNKSENEQYEQEISSSDNESARGMSFIGDFYPQKRKNNLARVQISPTRSGDDDESAKSENDVNKSTCGKSCGERVGPAGERLWRVVVEKQESSSSTPPDRHDEEVSKEREDSIESVVVPESAITASLSVVASLEGRTPVDPNVEREKEEAQRRKECACVETGNGTPDRTDASSVHAVTPATSPPRLIKPDRGSHGSCEFEWNGEEIRGAANANNDDESVVARREDKNDRDVETREEYEINDTTKKTKVSGNAEMSATAAKRLAMPSSPARNNNEHSTITTKNDLTQRNIGPVTGSPVNERKKGGLGGFLQRFSRLRFSGRSKVPRSEVTKKTSDSANLLVGDSANKRTTGGKLIDEQPGTTRRKKEPDYIIIPLHAPEDERRGELQDDGETDIRNKPRRATDLERSASCASPNGRPPVSSKPPLPPSHHQSLAGGGSSGGGGGGGGGARNIGATGSSGRCGSAGVIGNTRRRAATDLGSPAAIEMAKARAMQASQEPRPVGLLETDLDAEPVVSSRNINLSVNGASASSHAVSIAAVTNNNPCNNQAGKKTRSLLNLNHTSGRQGRDVNHHLANENELRVPHSPGTGARNSTDHQDHHNSVGTCINQRPHKSMEFLLDKENLHFVKPPENELQKVGERVPSEHELRVQRSLQRLNVPDWYKNSPAARDGFRLKRHSDASQHGGWRSLGSKTTSLSSLSSSSNRQPTTGVLLSPSPTPPVFSRWSTSLLNSAGSSPASSARSSFNHRQPYLGWRSQERLANPRTPAERLAQGILPQLQSTKKQQQQQQTNQQLEVRNSIKEVTSAIVHYVQSGQEVAGGGRLSPRPRPDDWDDRGGARSTSPRGSVKLCWMESSFVGSRPVDSPETPMSLATDTECCAGCNATGTESCSCVDSATSGLYLDLTPTRDEPQQRHRPGGVQQQQLQQQPQQQLQQQQQQLQQQGSRSLCQSPSSTSNYYQQIQQHHHAHLQQQQHQQHQRHHRGSGQSEDDEAMATAALLRNKPSPGSTTLEDVLDSLLGLPSASRTPSPGPGPISGSSSIRHHRTSNTVSTVGQPTSNKAGKSCSDLRQDLQESARGGTPETPIGTEGGGATSYYVGELVRRKSEGSDIVPPHRSSSRTSNLRNRRVSFDNAQNTNENNASTGVPLAEKLVRCRNNKCNNAATLVEARRVYKSCHNCTCLYCSRECRRAHWQRHRRTCLHSRAGTLCRQVLSSAKEDPATLKHISALAQRGYASHGPGAVKCFFTSPEIAEQFVSNGFVDLGEPTYVKWSELLPSEMGAELYAEVMRLCKSYNPETRLVLYVAVCVVSEVPSSGAVRWERQLVSRCGKIRLDSSYRQPNVTATSTTASPPGRQATASPCNITREMDSPETLVLTSMPGSDGQNTPRSAREIGFTNIQRQLRLRGVSLRRHFPQVYTKLCSYVDGTVDKFAPVTIYPRDQASGKSFMCIIMLDAEPERLQLLPTDSSRVRTVDISVEQE